MARKTIFHSLLGELEQRIGRLPAGTILPAEQALADEYGVSKPTLRRALAELAEHGLIAKENVVGTFGVLFGGFDEVAENGWQIWANMREVFTPLAAYSFLVFNLLCAPCFAAMGAIKREMNSAKWTLFAIGYQCVFAYAVSLVLYQLGMLFTGHGNLLGSIFAFAIAALILYLLFRPYKESRTLSKPVKI